MTTPGALTNATALLDQMAHELAADPHGTRAQGQVANIRSQALEVVALAEQACGLSTEGDEQ